MRTLFVLFAISVNLFSPPYYNVKALTGLSCPTSSHQAPCYEYGQADVIFIGTAVEVTKIDWDEPSPVYWNPHKKVIARLKIEEAFKGIEGEEVILEMVDCPYYFNEGEQYLVYSNRNPGGELSQDNSSPTRPVSEAREDIEYIRGLKDTKPAGKIYGAVIRNSNSFKPRTLIRDGKNKPEVPLPGIKIVIENSQQKFETITSDKGLFEFDNIPAGNYRVRTTVSGSFGLNGTQEIKVSGYGCFHAAISVIPKGQVSGRILNAEGLPLGDVRVYIFTAEGVTEEVIENLNKQQLEPGDFYSLDTDKDGRYKIQTLPKGNYIIAVSLIKDRRKSKVGSKQYPRTFYPGVPNFSRATFIALDEGEVKQNLDIQIPSETTP